MRAFVRLLCGLADLILVMAPVQFMLIGVFHVPGTQANFLFTLLFAVYNALFEYYFKGQTPGKWVGKLTVAERDGAPVSLLYLGLRELTKSLYFIPYLGWILGGVSFILLLTKEKPLHDVVGNTRVIFIWQKKKLEETHDERGSS